MSSESSEPASTGERRDSGGNALAGDHLYASARKRGLLLVFALLAGTLSALIAVFFDFAEADLLTRISEGSEVSESELEASDDMQSGVAIVQMMFFVITAALWLVWFSRAYKNLPSLGAPDLRFKPGWAIGAWFVPFLNLVRPKAIADDIWRTSEPAAPIEQDWKGRRVSPLLHFWWGFFLLSSFLGQAVTRQAFQTEADSLEDLQIANVITTVSDLLDVPLTILAILVVWRITRRQEARARMLGLLE